MLRHLFRGTSRAGAPSEPTTPRAIRLMASRLNGVLTGYVGVLLSRGAETSMSFMDRPGKTPGKARIIAQPLIDLVELGRLR